MEEYENRTSTNIDMLLSLLEKSGKKYDLAKITSAYEYAKRVHEGQMRKSGDPYITHPIAVAEIVASLGLDTDSIVAAFLHDTIEDQPDRANLKEIGQLFGPDVAMLVDGLTKMADINIEDKEEAHMENIRKMLLAMSKDIRVIFVKLCDRLHNMRTLVAKKDEKRRSTALETMHIYAPLAHRLGMQKIKQELENLALSFLDPIGYEEVNKHIEEKYGKNRDFIEKTRSIVAEGLEKYNIHFTLEGRVKTTYSIYRKMFNQSKSFDEIYDFYALRIIVETELECYTALGIIHEMFKSIPGRFKDYISTPKPNMYQSLHTTVIGSDGIPFEVQIRTKEMHEIAEYGIAAHWKYKSGDRSSVDIDSKLEWISKLIDTENDAVDPDDFMDAFKVDVFHDETFVFTPKGDVIALPQGSTLIDFAYAIHSEVGNKMVGAKINGMISPIDKVPQNGEIVEILTSASSKGPSRDWLKIVQTSQARNKIRQWFKKERRTENIEIGRSDLFREIQKFGHNLNDGKKLQIIEAVSKRIGMNSTEDLLNAVGYGGVVISKLIPKMRDEFDKIVKSEAPETPLDLESITVAAPKNIRPGSGVVVDGEHGVSVKYAKCCNPLPGDPIIGFITKGYGVSVHKRDCPNVLDSMQKEENLERWVRVEWETVTVSASSANYYEANMQIFAEDNLTLLAELTSALADMKVSLLSINTKPKSKTDIMINLTVRCKNTDHYNSIVSRLRSISSIKSITRGYSF